MKALRVIVLSYPLALPAAFLWTWLTARFCLGHWPRPALDDPKTISAWVDIPYTITALLLGLGLPLFAVALLALLYFAIQNPICRRELLRVIAFSVALVVVVILTLRWDPWSMVSWYLD